MLKHRLYFALRPFIPQTLRTGFRRKIATRLKARVQDTWPIMPGSEIPPADWHGWPDGKQFALVLTHDVESAKGLERVSPLAQLEMDLQLRSSFNFVPEGSYQVSASMREWLEANDFEVGVHDLRHDGKLYASRGGFNRRAERINHYLREWNAVGFRSGFMFRNLEWIHQLDIDYDASTFDTDPFEPQPAGRNTIFPLWVPQPATSHLYRETFSKHGGYVELPYTLPQDFTLFLLLRESSIQIWKDKLDWIVENGGMALMNTHPDYMTFTGASTAMEFPVTMYQELLEYIETRYSGLFWKALPRDIAVWSLQNRGSLTSIRSHPLQLV